MISFKPPLTPTTEQLIEAIEQFAKKEIEPIAASLDKSNQFPASIWPKLGQMGLLGITIEPQYGGLGLGYFEHVLAMEIISKYSAAIGLSYGAHSNLCVNQIQLHGHVAQKQAYLPKLVSGQWVGALAMSEPEAGSDVMNMQLKAKQVGDFFVLNGTKMWITNGSEADVMIVYAKTAPEQGKHGITAFIVEKTYPGVRPAQPLDKLGMRGSNTCELVFTDCRVPAKNILGTINQGIEILMQGLDYERVILAAGPVGIMQACLDMVLPYMHARKQFGQPIGSFQLMQAKLADMYTELSASRAYLYAIAQACDKGEISRKDAASVILFTAERATQMALQAIQCLGGNGYINEYPAGRLLRDAKLYEIGGGTSEIRRMLIGREIFKESS